MGFSTRDNVFYKAWDAVSKDRDAFIGLDRQAREGHRGLRRVLRERGDLMAEYTTDELMIVNAARQLGALAAAGKRQCFVGIGLPSTAANLARRLYPVEPVLIYESGCLDSKPTRLPLSIGDGELAETSDAVVSVPEIFAYWLQSGRIDIGFLSGAQLDKYANINSTVIGSYENPKTRLPGAGGAPEIAASAGSVMVIMRQSMRSVRRALRLPHLDRLRRRQGRPRAVRPARWRAEVGHHRPRRDGAGSRHLRARRRRAASGHHPRTGRRRDRMGRPVQRRRVDDRRADRRRARHAARAAGCMKPFTYDQLPARIVFGAGRLADVGAEVERLGGRHVMLISDCRRPTLPAAAVTGQLGARLALAWTEVAQHVPVELADRARAAATEASVDCVVCIGGGSSTGLAKAIALSHGVPILAVPTTYAGSEQTTIYGLTGGRHKQTGKDPIVQPRTVVYDPELTVGLPPHVTGPSAFNALAHSVEALYAPGHNPVTTVLALEGVRAIHDSLPTVMAYPGDVDARGTLLYGAYLSGVSLGTTASGLHHKLCHVLGGRVQPRARRRPLGDPAARDRVQRSGVARRHGPPRCRARVAGR